MFTWIWIFEIVLFELALRGAVRASRPFITCEEFERGARFNPYQAIDTMWKIFYFWANNSEVYPIVFSLPTKQRIDKFRIVLEAVDPDLAEQLQWRLATLVMQPKPGTEVLMMYAGTPGAFRALVKLDRKDPVSPHRVPLIKLADIRMKIVDRYMGMMCCEDFTMYALSRLYEVPKTESECEVAATKLGFPYGGGYSYLYLHNLTKKESKVEL